MEPRSRGPSWPPTSCGPSRSTRGAGVIFDERRAGAKLQHGGRGSEFVAYEWLREAMTWYEKAEAIRPAGNDDALLRWNTCARILTRNPHLQRGPEDHSEPPLE